MDYDNIVDNEDQLYNELLEDEEKNKTLENRDNSSNNYDDETQRDY